MDKQCSHMLDLTGKNRCPEQAVRRCQGCHFWFCLEHLENHPCMEVYPPRNTALDALMEAHIREVEARWRSETAEREAGED